MACCQEQACNVQIRRQTDRRFREPIGLIPTRPVYPPLPSLFFFLLLILLFFVVVIIDVVAAGAAGAVVGFFPLPRSMPLSSVVVVVVAGGAAAAVGPDGRAGAPHGGVRAPGLS